MARDTSHSVTFFKDFVQADTFPTIIESFKRLCDSLDIDTKNFKTVYTKLKDGIRTVEAVNLWKLLDKRAELNVYSAGNICKGKKVFIIGAGLCGLRMALEARLLGSQVVVIDMRDYMTRNNVIHLWPPVIHDLKAIGAKTFYKKFCMGSLDHISIRMLQCILLKISLVVGVEIHAPVKYVELKPPSSNKGWTAILEPADHPVNNYEFDFIVGADRKRNSLKGFRRKCFRAKQAIAITFNLVNNKTKADNQVEEIIGTKTLYVFGRHLFNKLKTKADIDLEILVYFKDKTHYFVMTARKSSLLNRGVLKEDISNDRELLSPNNVNKDNLRSFAIDASQIATDYAMPSKEFNQTHCGEDDIAIFDFSTIFQCEHSTLIRHRDGHDLVVTNVGDGLIEPFWPTGSGAGRGFLSVLDAAWLLRMWGQGRPPLDCLAEKETLYQMLLQFPGSLKKEFSGYTIDPSTRYIDMADKVLFSHKQVEHLYMTQDQISNETDEIIKNNNDLLNHCASTSEK